MITVAVAFVAIVLLVLTLQDVFEVMLLPRRVIRRTYQGLRLSI